MVNHFPFPVAAHSYFVIRNKNETKRTFLKSQTTEPHFSYGPILNINMVQAYLLRVPDDSFAKKTLRLVEAAALLQLNPDALDTFRKANLAIIHKPKKVYVEAILSRIADKVTPETQAVWDQVILQTGLLKSFSMTTPSEVLFHQYAQYLRRYAGILKTKGLTISEILQSHLESTGLRQKGWTVAHSANIESPPRTNHRTNTIWIGEDYQPHTVKAKKRIVTHEVYGHALRGPQMSISEAEGFAIVLEQLTSPSFKYRRSYRYLAVALGWGVLGSPMTFRQVFEILWRVMLIGSNYSRLQARQFAFDETYRAFRGGRPEIAGSVFLKDSIYFDANIAIWNVLIDQEFSYNEFVDIIEGRRTLLS